MSREQKLRPQSETDRLLCRVRILYIEDDIGLGRLMQKRLERLVYKVDVAQDGREGLKLFANGSYDVVITDYSMPILNGLEVLQELKDLTPVIILTGQGDERVAVTAMKLGAADYVTKDAEGDYIELLPSIIDRVMERQQLISDRRQAQSELRASEERYRAIVEDQTEMICRVQPGGQLTFANGAFCHYFGIRPTDIVFQNLSTLLSKKTYQDMKGILKTLTRQTPVKMIFHSLKMIDGKACSLEWTCRAIFEDSSKLREYQLVGRDITELKRVEEALRESEAKNSALLSAIPDPILRIDQNGKCVDIRSKKNHVLELSADFAGKNITEIFPADGAALLLDHINKLFQEGVSQAFRFNLGQGETISHQEARLVFVGANEALVIVRDVTEWTKLEQQLQNLSTHDCLTGLYNRAYFTEEMRRLENGKYNSVGIVVCDIDELKTVNDNLGHSAGDDLLKAAANVILHAFCGSDTIARIGGDEFAVLLPNATPAVTAEACKRLRKAVERHTKAKPEQFLSISVGAAVSSAENPDLTKVFEEADRNMYDEKLNKKKDR